MLDIAGMGTIAPVIVSVGREHFPAVQTGGFIECLGALANRQRIFRPPLPAAHIRAELSFSPAHRLNKRRATVFAAGGNLCYCARSHTGKMVGCAKIADGIPAKAKLCRNGPIPQIAFSEQPNLLSLFIRQRHVPPPLLFPWKSRFAEMTVGCRFVVIDRF